MTGNCSWVYPKEILTQIHKGTVPEFSPSIVCVGGEWETIWVPITGEKGTSENRIYRDKHYATGRNNLEADIWIDLKNSVGLPGSPVFKNLPYSKGHEFDPLVQEDLTCCAATKSMHHNYQAHMLQVLKSAHLEPVLLNKEATSVRSLNTVKKIQYSKIYK